MAYRILISVLLGTLAILSLTHCSMRDFGGVQEAYRIASATPAPASSGSSVGGATGANQALSHFKPALAVRATGCLMCHAKVNANLITDFGYGGDGAGSDYFLGQGDPNSTHSFASGAIYGDEFRTNFSSASITGKVFVPKAPVPSSLVASVGASSLYAYLSGKLTASSESVTEASSIYIGAPTPERILSVGGFTDASTAYRYLPDGASSPALSGIQLDSSGRYLRTESGTPLQCEGDLVARVPVFLKDVQLQTGNKGCRIYSSEAIFLQGPLSFPGTATNRNLQLVSARGILLGLGPGNVTAITAGTGGTVSNILEFRFQTDPQRSGYFTRGAGSTQSKLDRIVSTSQLIPDLAEAGYATGGSNQSFERLLLNAPNVQSRYTGQFKGVVIAEIAMFELNAFAFTFDPVFSDPSVPILPLLKDTDYLTVTQ